MNHPLTLTQLGLLLASDWVLNLRLVLWENRGKDESVSLDICPGFYQDLESLSKLATLLPSASSRVCGPDKKLQLCCV